MPTARSTPVVIDVLESRVLLSAGAPPQPAVPRGGAVVTAVTDADDEANAVAVQRDGKILVAGQAQLHPPDGGTVTEGVLVRYNRDGSLDQTFGSGGKVAILLGSLDQDTVSGVAVEPDGTIIVAGTHGVSTLPIPDSSHYLYWLLRAYHPDGSDDLTFDANVAGVLKSLDAASGQLNALTLQPDGKIVVAGSFYPSGQFGRTIVARFDADGTLDGSFVSPNLFSTTFYSGTHDIFRSVVVRSDGKIVVGGYAATGDPFKWGLLGLNADGTVDTSFGGGVVVRYFSNDYDYLQGLAATYDDKVVAVGYSFDSHHGTDAGVHVVRYTSQGMPDGSFAQGGTLDFNLPFGQFNSIAVEQDGSLVIAGSAAHGGNLATTVVRLRANGSMDPAFGTGGVASQRIGAGGSGASDVAIDAEGRVVLVGIAGAGLPPGPLRERFAVAVFTPDGASDATFGVPYDMNHNGIVDFADLLTLAAHFGKSGSFADGDLNGDGVINMDDLLLLARDYGNTDPGRPIPPTQK